MPNLTPAELAEGLAAIELGDAEATAAASYWFRKHGESALRELAALREQLAAERAKRAALVAEFQRRCDERKWPKPRSAEAVAWHDAAVLLAALDQDPGDGQ